MSSLRPLLSPKTRISTSPTVPGSSKKSLLTPSASQESAWTSSSVPSYIHLTFPAPITNATHFAITFQGGFAASSLMVYLAMAPKEGSSEVELGLMMARRVYPEDKSSRQVFEIPYLSTALISPHTSPLPTFSSLSTEELNIQTERLPNTNGTTPAPLLPAAANKLPARYQQGIEATLDSADASANGNGVERVKSNDSGVLKDKLAAGWSVPALTEIKFEFEGTSDNQGRVTVYAIEVLGS